MNYFKRKKILNTGKPPRENGHYWVVWSGLHTGIEAWQIAWYFKGLGVWQIPGNDRYFYDRDFIKINENRIPFTTGQLHKSFWYWFAVTVNLLGFGYYTFYLLTHR